MAKMPVATTVTRDQHPVSRKHISKSALKVLYRLRDGGFKGYLVGGCIRDILLDQKPKDFDVVTDAHPDEIRDLFRNCRLIGRRFRLAHIVFGREIIEVATFRAAPNTGEVNQRGRIMQDNVYGTIEDDVMRRDFTINAMYYSIEDFSITDYVGALDDIEKQQIKLLGDPETRYKEDPVRALRAVRFASKLDFAIEEKTAAAIAPTAHHLQSIPSARLFEEVLKLFLSGHGRQSLQKLREYDLLQYLFPLTDKRLKSGDQICENLLLKILDNTDQRIREERSVTPAFLFAAFLWREVEERALALQSDTDGRAQIATLMQASEEVIAEQCRATAIPKRFSLVSRDIWTMQARLLNYSGKRALKNLQHLRFRAGYDFLMMRSEAGDDWVTDRAVFWRDIQEVSEEDQAEMVTQLVVPKSANGNPRKRRPRRRHKKGPKTNNRNAN